jgi:hypothetical protein
MFRAPITAVCLLLLVVGVALNGCGKAREAMDAAQNVKEAQKMAGGEKATFKTDQGDVQVQAQPGKDKGEATIKTTTPEGKETTTNVGKTVDKAKLGIELYPGAAVETSANSASDEGGMTMAALSTNDPFDKVAKFYKGKYPKATAQELYRKGKQALIMQIGAGNDMKVVTIGEEGGKVKIGLQHTVTKK